MALSSTRTELISTRDKRSTASFPSVCTQLGLSYVQLLTATTGLKIKTRQGAFSQYTRLPATHVVPRPQFLKPTEAAGLGLAGLTAYEALLNVGKLQPGQHLFINGGSTAVGIVAIQLAKALGCTVTVTASSKREDFVRSLGADNVRTWDSTLIRVSDCH